MNTLIPSIIIAVYNQHLYLEKVLLSLLNQSYADFQVIIADDGSGEEVVDVIKKYSSQFNCPILHVWHEDLDFRKTLIANEAVRQSANDYLIFIDGDCLLHHRFVERHVTRAKKGEVLSGRRLMLNEDLSSRLSNEDVVKRRFEKIRYWYAYRDEGKLLRGICLPFLYGFTNKFTKPYWLFGSNFSLYKKDFYSVNGYDETIVGRGLEDINLSQRIKLLGLPIRKLTYEAIQYHLFHYSKPVPHEDESLDAIVYPKEAYVKQGVTKMRK